jgi:signal peptidase I
MADQSLLKQRWKKLPIFIAIAVPTAIFWMFIFWIKGGHAYVINGGSMTPTLVQDERVWSDEHLQANSLQRGQILVYRKPIGEADDPPFLHRLIGLPGDTIAIKDGKVILNGKPLNEPYIAEPARYTMPLLKVPPGEYFVLGDNRNNSADSHVWGSIPYSSIKGTLRFQYWPGFKTFSP